LLDLKDPMLLVSQDQVEKVDGLLVEEVVVLILPPTLLVMVAVLVDHMLVVVRDKIQIKQLPVEHMRPGVEAVAWAHQEPPFQHQTVDQALL
tara:strand:+ start:142 stop:417 length:276 start_codon:yes stop_codon:yes gene_type:complete